jgi:large subunit ribosomal protein L25
VDVSGLDIGDSIHVEDLPREGDIEIPAEVNFTVLTVVSPKMEEVEEEEELEEGEEVEAEDSEEAPEEE